MIFKKKDISNPIRFIQCVERRWKDLIAPRAMSTANSTTINDAFWGTVSAMNDYNDLRKFWDKCFVKIITGKQPVSAWDHMSRTKHGGQ
jgi:putative aldouronate transport system substrate-binding protein